MLDGRTITFFLVNLVATLASISAFGDVSPIGLPVTLGWNASASIDTAGYRLYYGGASGDYTNTLDVGNSTIAIVPNLAIGRTYYFALTVYNGIGLESAFSAEVSYTVPPGAALVARALALSKLLLSGRGPVGYVYDIQSSTDLRTWNRLASVTMDASGAFEFTIPNTRTNVTRWYRLRQTSP